LGIIFGAVAFVILGVFLVLRAVRISRKEEIDSHLEKLEPFSRSDGGIRRDRSLSETEVDQAPGNRDRQEYLEMQLRTMQKQLEDLRGVVTHAPDRAEKQNEILRARIRRLELELQSYREGGSDHPPPRYLDQYNSS
jgi:uncharacterized coiled-coil protein SlyX